MSRFSRSVPAGILALLVVAACDDEPVTSPVESTSSMPALAASVGSGPTQPGDSPITRVVIEGRVFFAFWSANPVPTVLLYQTDDSFNILGTDCQDASVTTEPVGVQDVASPGGALHRLIQAKEMLTTVYDAQGLPPFPPLDCAFLLGDRRLADGTSRIISTDSDRLGTGSGSRTIKFQGNGRLELGTDGSPTNLNHQIHFQINASDGSFRVLKDEITLSRDPRL